ncbi:hypothetical protein C8A00DRAFT_34229 [Chaetomidium leptoderma]|uniref:Uncharacterized protein n=1 Tax=Chaetomidium leptoderma TaxID=669021 RepID=A0AAN6VK49_9PEZI|nr:hypothetical protein C8A00DRAFT_34229 [Chaetomidium leptoderma]
MKTFLLSTLAAFIRTDPDLVARFGGGARPLVVFNPGGTGALQAYYDMQPDLIVALETCFACPTGGGGYERYDHDGAGSSIDDVLFPAVGAANAAHTAVLVHGFHDFNGPAANLSATEGVLQELIQGVVQRGIGATFFNTAGYHTFTDGRPASIGKVAEVLNAANGV